MILSASGQIVYKDIFAIIFCAYYICKVMDMFDVNAEDYYWKGFLLRKVSDLWYVSFFYVVGMLFVKEKIISRTKRWLDRAAGKKQNVYLLAAVIVVTLGLCVIEISASIYFFSIFYFICFHVWKKSDRIKKVFLFLGKHSTNIWLVHMFFYLCIFKDLVFVVKYPVFILAFMFGLTLACSYIIDFIMKLLWKITFLQKLVKGE